MCGVLRTWLALLTRKSMTFRLPVDLMKAVDETRGDVSRTRFLERALEAALKNGGAAGDVPQAAGSSAQRTAPPRASASPSLDRFR